MRVGVQFFTAVLPSGRDGRERESYGRVLGASQYLSVQGALAEGGQELLEPFSCRWLATDDRDVTVDLWMDLSISEPPVRQVNVYRHPMLRANTIYVCRLYHRDSSVNLLVRQ